MEAIKKGSFNLKTIELQTVSEKAKNFIKKLLEYNYNKRISAEEALNDPWIKSIENDIKKSKNKTKD